MTEARTIDRHPDAMLKPDEAAEVVRLSPRTLKNHRANKTGPKYIRHGNVILYRYGDLIEWMEPRKQG